MDSEEKNLGDFQTLAQRLTAGDEIAANTIFHRYLRRLTALARAKLSLQIGRRVDPEDAVQSAFLSFFLGARSGRFTLEHSSDLWRLLATITTRKASRLGVCHRAAKRSVRRESVPDESGDRSSFSLADDRMPQPDEAAVLAEELVEIMQSLPLDLRRVLQLRLQDTSVSDIAVTLSCTERTVRRKLEELRDRMERRFDPTRSSDPEEIRDTSDVIAVANTMPSPSPRTERSVASGLPSIDYRELLLLSHLGTGGMGRVYRALLRSTGEQVAVKVLKKSRQRNRRTVERFLTEIETVSRLTHPNITRLHGYGRMPGGGYFFVMQLIGQSDLHRRIAANDYSATDVAHWMRGAASALALATGHGIIHCDLKPSNVLIDCDGRAVVSDFGFAVALSDSSQPIGGTIEFLAPELLDPHGRVTPATDVWGLGATLYSLIYRRPPRSIDQAPLTTARITQTAPAFQATPSPFIGICRRALQVAPDDRFSTAAEFLSALESACP